MPDPSITVEEGCTLIEALSAIHPEAKKNSLRRMISQGRTRIDGIRGEHPRQRVGPGATIVILFPFGCSNERDEAWRQSLLTLAFPHPCLVSPATGHPRFAMWSLIWALLPVSILILMSEWDFPVSSRDQCVMASLPDLLPGSTSLTLMSLVS